MREANQFSKISSIDTCDEETWKNKVFLTFDIDWAADEVIEDVPRQSLDHEVSGVDDAVDHGRQLDRLHHIYGVGVALVGMYVGLLGQSNRQR